MAGKSVLGTLERSAFGLLELPRLPGALLAGFPENAGADRKPPARGGMD
jgi:hypothetical protein